jgi:hypothetical protein
MDFYEALVAQAHPVSVEPSETSYFSAPGAGLDPRLIQSGKVNAVVRSSILRILFEHLARHYYSPEAYVHVWLAGSGISYQWTAARNPADLDCLVGVNYLLFRQANPDYKALSDKEIAAMFNENFRKDVHPNTNNFLNAFELTFYVNVNPDIKALKPYAAYSLTNDDWVVTPEMKKPPVNKAWDQIVLRDTSMTNDILSRYTKALTELGSATTDTARRNAEAALKLAVEQGAAVFDAIHQGRSSAFSPSGQGYMDAANYRWQAGKASGTIQALKKLKDISTKSRKAFESETYGMELPDASTLIRRTLTYKNV